MKIDKHLDKRTMPYFFGSQYIGTCFIWRFILKRVHATEYCAVQNGGLLTASYDMGKGVRSVVEPRYSVDDGHYHVARLRRHGANVTLQLDDHSPRAIRPAGACQHGSTRTQFAGTLASDLGF